MTARYSEKFAMQAFCSLTPSLLSETIGNKATSNDAVLMSELRGGSGPSRQEVPQEVVRDLVGGNRLRVLLEGSL